MNIKHMLLIALMMAVSLAYSSVHAELAIDERFPVRIPTGYVLGAQQTDKDPISYEFIPEGQTVDNWQDMITVLTLPKLAKLTPTEFADYIKKSWTNSCEKSESSKGVFPLENGYHSAFWVAFCPLSSVTKKPELTFFKATQGKKAMYVVQRSFTYMPEEQDFIKWSQYLASIFLCDAKDDKHPCITADQNNPVGYPSK